MSTTSRDLSWRGPGFRGSVTPNPFIYYLMPGLGFEVMDRGNVSILSITLLFAVAIFGGLLLLEHRRRRQVEIEALTYLLMSAHMGRQTAMGELTASLTHALAQPLAAILRNAEAAKLLLAANADPAELAEIVEDIRNEDKRATELIRRMRSMLRRQNLEVEPVDVNAIAEDAVGLVAADAVEKGVRVELQLRATPCVVAGDRIHLEQVVLNLMFNGMDALSRTPPDDRRLVVSTERNNGHVDVSVRDTGPGIPSGALSRVFEPFYTTKKEGMGMGLSIARSIVEAHDGRIVAENNSGGGATVRVSLPIEASGRTSHAESVH